MGLVTKRENKAEEITDIGMEWGLNWEPPSL